jgi:hypothetical protein
MTTKRFVAACAAAFVVSQILEILIHGFILAPDYAPFYGKLLRPMDRGADWRGLLLPVAHLSFIIAFVWIYARAAASTLWVRSGIVFGVFGWAIGQVPLWLLWHAEQPWPDSLVVKQLALELVAAVVVGLVVAAIVRAPGPRTKDDRWRLEHSSGSRQRQAAVGGG